jgi:hypothetical protein
MGSRKKKTGHAAEQDREDVAEAREEWFEGELDLDPEKRVFIDETSVSTNMARRLGRAPSGEPAGRRSHSGVGRRRR